METLFKAVGIFFGVWFVAFVVDLIHDGWTGPTKDDIKRIKKEGVQEYKDAVRLEELRKNPER